MKNVSKKLFVVVMFMAAHVSICTVKPAPFLSDCWGAPGYDGYVPPAPGIPSYKSDGCKIAEDEQTEQLYGLSGNYIFSCFCGYSKEDDMLRCLCKKNNGENVEAELAHPHSYDRINNIDGVLIGEN